jgi:hypothetical protein
VHARAAAQQDHFSNVVACELGLFKNLHNKWQVT